VNPTALFPERLDIVLQYLEAKKSISGHSAAIKAAQAITAFASRLQKLPNLQLLRDFATSCRHEIGDRPAMQARPFHPQALPLLLAFLGDDLPLKATIYIAWKTASRIGEVLVLDRSAFLEISPSMLLVDFLRTKTNQSGSWRGDHLVLIEQLFPIPTWFINFIRQLSPGATLCSRSTSAIDKILSRFNFPLPFCPSEENLVAVRPNFTAHSFKRGALAVLWEAAARGHLELRLVAHLAKHKQIGAIPDSTVGYAASKLQVALALKSHHATRLL
jgi:hypothetical protein